MDKSRAEKAGKQMGLTIIEMVNLMYQKNTAKNFYKGLFLSLEETLDPNIWFTKEQPER